MKVLSYLWLPLVVRNKCELWNDNNVELLSCSWCHQSFDFDDPIYRFCERKRQAVLLQGFVITQAFDCKNEITIRKAWGWKIRIENHKTQHFEKDTFKSLLYNQKGSENVVINAQRLSSFNMSKIFSNFDKSYFNKINNFIGKNIRMWKTLKIVF